MQNSRLIAGLGNPGKEYELTRHNVGSRIVRAFSEKTAISNGVIVALPMVFMNESGKAILSLMKRDRIAPRQLMVVHDDADIAFGKFKFSFGSRSAGHKGAESVINALGTKDFWRLRIGIQPIGIPRHIRADDLVLKPFSLQEEAELSRIIEGVIGAIEAWVEKSQV